MSVMLKFLLNRFFIVFIIRKLFIVLSTRGRNLPEPVLSELPGIINLFEKVHSGGKINLIISHFNIKFRINYH